MAPYENGSPCLNGTAGAGRQLLHLADLFRHERAVGDFDGHVLDGGGRAMAGEGEETHHKVETAPTTWRVIEVGDGQVSDLAGSTDPAALLGPLLTLSPAPKEQHSPNRQPQARAPM